MVSVFEVSAVSFTLNGGGEVAVIPFLSIVLVGIVFVVPPALFRKAYFYRRRLKKNVITAEYEPPLGLNPAEIGYLFDGKLREREIAATIIHLVQRGYLHVKAVKNQKKIYAGPRIGDDLKTYEKKLIEQALSAGEEGASADQLLSRFMSYKYKSKNLEVTSGPRELIFTQLVHSDLKRRQYVKGSMFKTFLLGAVKIGLGLQIITIFIPLTILWVAATASSGAADIKILLWMWFIGLMICIFFFFPFVVAGAVLNYLRGRIIGREWIITPKLSRLWPQIVGYRQYIKLVENDRLEFYSKEMKKISRNDTLPYAVALGFVKNWRDLLY